MSRFAPVQRRGVSRSLLLVQPAVRLRRALPSLPAIDLLNMTTQSEPVGNLERSRRDKLERIQQLGFDPWGGRFDGRLSIGRIRDRADEIQFQKETGESIPLPELETQPEFDFRQWLSEQGPGELVGPRVRAAGRVVLLRDTGKLKFIDIRDQTGQIQLFVGKEAGW